MSPVTRLQKPAFSLINAPAVLHATNLSVRLASPLAGRKPAAAFMYSEVPCCRILFPLHIEFKEFCFGIALSNSENLHVMVSGFSEHSRVDFFNGKQGFIEL